MALSAVTAGDQATAAQYNAIKNHLEGDASSTLAWFLRCTASQNFVVKLSDAGGVQKFSIQDSDGAEVAQINSNGDFTLSGTFTIGALQLPTGTAPTPTADGEMWWDTDNDRLVIGDGASQVLIAATHAEAHTVASHSDTSGTGAELNTLTDGSETTLHSHAVSPTGWEMISGAAIAASTTGFDVGSFAKAYKLFRLTLYIEPDDTVDLSPMLRFNGASTNYNSSNTSAYYNTATEVISYSTNQAQIVLYQPSVHGAMQSSDYGMTVQLTFGKTEAASYLSGFGTGQYHGADSAWDVRMHYSFYWENTSALVTSVALLSGNAFQGGTYLLEGFTQ